MFERRQQVSLLTVFTLLVQTVLFPLIGNFEGALLASGPPHNPATPLPPAVIVSLNFPPAKNDPLALKCDQLADSPLDPLKVNAGVPGMKLQLDQAIPACQQAYERQSSNPRYQYLYGRVLSVAGRFSDAIPLYTSADRAGYGLASYNLADIYRDGLSVTADWNEAYRLYLRAANAGLADAFADAGALYVRRNPPDYRQALSLYEQAVQHGSGDGAAALGYLYYYGRGVNTDPGMAFNLFNQAAKAGSSEGMYRLAIAYDEGVGTRKDPATACQWFVGAANYGHPWSLEEAGRCYYKGIGVPQDHVTAFQLFVLAGQAGSPTARNCVADMLDLGEGTAKDQQAAVHWYEASANQGDLYAMTELGLHYRQGQGVAWSEARAMEWFNKAAQKQYAPAETNLALGYMSGLGKDVGQGRVDYPAAVRWFTDAARQGEDYAVLNLGIMVELGWGVQRDPSRAKSLYLQAATSNVEPIAELGRKFASQISASATQTTTPTRPSSDSDDLLGKVVLGAVLIGGIALLMSGGSSHSSNGGSGDYDGGYSGGGYTPSMEWPSSTTTELPPMQGGGPHPYDPVTPWHIPNGDLTQYPWK